MYLNFLQNESPQLLEGVFFSKKLFSKFDEFSWRRPKGGNTLSTRWISHNVFTWSASLAQCTLYNVDRSRWCCSRLQPLEFFVWSCMKSLVYGSPVRTEQELLNRIMDAAVKVRGQISFKVTVRERKGRVAALDKIEDTLKTN